MSRTIRYDPMGKITQFILEAGFHEVSVTETPNAVVKFINILQKHTPPWYFKECEFIVYPNYEQFLCKNMSTKWPSLRKVIKYQLYDLPRLDCPKKYTLYGAWSKHRRFRANQLRRFVRHHTGGRCRLFSETKLLENLDSLSSLAMIHHETKIVKRFKKTL